MRIGRRLVHALILVVVLVCGATMAIVIVSQTTWFKNWLRGYIVREAGQYLNGTLSIDRLDGNLFFGIEMENVAVSMDGSQVVAVRDVGLDYSVFELISKGLAIDSLRLNQPVIYLRREGDAWSISRLIKKQEQEADRQGPTRPISIGAITITGGSVLVEGPVGTSGVMVPKRFEHLDAKLAFNYEPVRYTIDMTQVSFQSSDPEIVVNALSGAISVRQDSVYVERLAVRTAETSLSIDGAVQQYRTNPVVRMQITSEKFSLPEVARMVPALAGIHLQPAFELKLDGPLDRMNVDMNVRSSAGHVTGTIAADLKTPRQSASGTMSVRQLDLSPILNDATWKSDITGEVDFDVHGDPFSNTRSLGGSVSVDASRVVAAGFAADQVKATAKIGGRRITVDGRAAAYGATISTTGRVLLPEKSNGSVAFDLRGQAGRVDLSRLPRDLNVPPAATNINGAYHLRGSVHPSDGGSDGWRTIEGDMRFATSTVAGATIGSGSTASVAVEGEQVAYRADATVSGLDVERIGREFGVPALADERFKGSINGHIIASGSGTTPRTRTLTANGILHDSSILGGQVPQLTFDTELRQDSAHVRATGSFAGFDPAVVAGKPALKGTVGGTLDVDATIATVSAGITPDGVEATAKVSLDQSSVGGVEITSATIDGDYRDSTADIRTFDFVGRDLNVQATGTLALNETGHSELKVHADSASLDRIGKLVGRSLAGIADVDLTVTGNRTELQATGTINGGGVKYEGSGALAVSSEFVAKVPDLDVDRATVSATTRGTFVTIVGQNINELTATTDYVNKQVTFEVAAEQPQRTMSAAGSLVMHPDHQEVHLQRLALTTQGMTWQTAAGSQATIKYADEAVAVEDFKLVNGDQEITADGTFGRVDDSLALVFRNVDVAMVDALLLRPPQLSGRLNASAAVTSDVSAAGEDGSKRTPHVQAEFTIEEGGFRQYQYDSFGGTVSYTTSTVMLDAKLQQNPTTWLEVKGRVPTALFGEAGWTSSESIDLRVDSTPIDVGVVQGFTTALTNVTGTLEAHIHVGGTAADPKPDGTVTIQDAAFLLEPNGVSYTDLNGRIDLRPDRIHIEQIRLLDNHSSPLTVTGDLALRERNVGEMSIAVKATDFKVIDNEMGNIRLDSDLQLTGQLNAPRLEGDLGVTTGEINLDPILTLVGNSAYATEQIAYATETDAVPTPTAGASAPVARGLPELTGLLEALQVDVRLTVPNDLVVRGSDLRAPGGPVSLGTLNVTLGGDLYIHRVPYDQVRLYGPVNTVRGTYDFQGRRFTILRDGTVRFDGLDDFNPELDIRTERAIQGVTARVNVRGTFKQPQIVLSSTPPLEEADILSLIVFNQPANQLGLGQQMSLAARAQAIATGAVASQLARSIGDALNFDIFEISTSPDSGAAAELTIGQQVGQNLYVRVEQGIGDQTQTNFILEYELTDWLRLQTNVLQGSSTQQQLFERMQGSGVDLLFFFSY